MLWQNVTESIATHLLSHGLDQCSAIRLGMYNAAVPENLRITFGECGEDSLALLVGNSKAIWNPFISSLRARNWCSDISYDGMIASSGDGHCGNALERTWGKHPVDAYIMEKVIATVDLVKESMTELNNVRIAHYWGHETTPGRLIAIQRMAHIACLGWFHDATYLCLNPIHGPWVAFRAVILFDIPGPDTLPIQMMCPTSEEDLQHAADNMKNALESIKSYDKRGSEASEAFLNVRKSYKLGRDSQYCDQMIEYHYNNDLTFLEKIVQGNSAT